MAGDEFQPAPADPRSGRGGDGPRSAAARGGQPVRTDGGSDGQSREQSGGTEGGGSGGDGGSAPSSDSGDSEGSDGGGDLDVDPGLVREAAADLKRVDVRFLSAIRDINESPENYPAEHTSLGEVPASKPALREAAGLTGDQLDYRLKPGRRGLENIGPGLIELKAPPYRSSGAYGPRSAELTEFGRVVLAEAEGEEGTGDVTPAQTGAVSYEDFNAVQERIEAWEDDEFGAVDPDMAEDIRSLFREMVKFYQAFEALGIDAQQVFQGQELSEADQEEIAEALTTTVLERGADREGSGLGAGAGSGADAGDGGPAGGASGGSGNAEAAAPGSQERDDEASDEGNGGAEEADSRGLDEFGDGGEGR